MNQLYSTDARHAHAKYFAGKNNIFAAKRPTLPAFCLRIGGRSCTYITSCAIGTMLSLRLSSGEWRDGVVGLYGTENVFFRCCLLASSISLKTRIYPPSSVAVSLCVGTCNNPFTIVPFSYFHQQLAASLFLTSPTNLHVRLFLASVRRPFFSNTNLQPTLTGEQRRFLIVYT